MGVFYPYFLYQLSSGLVEGMHNRGLKEITFLRMNGNECILGKVLLLQNVIGLLFLKLKV
ncbi:hypothetical protein J19TS1_10300 [Heyndrickxia oleronia]|nr:hypothetical protein J19TS1_10300 [Heyndrickxia oleronia]